MRPRASWLPLALFLASAPAATAADQTSSGKAPKELKCLAARAEPWPQGFVKMTLPGGDAKYIAAQRISKITAQDGADWTNRVLEDRRSVEDGALEVCYAEQNSSFPSLRGRPLPERDWFPVIQAGFLVPLNPSDVAAEEGVGTIAVDLGAMRNVNQTTAAGVSVYLAADAVQSRGGAKLRLRRWLTRTVAIDVAPGVVVTGTTEEDYMTYSYPGLVGELSLSFADGVALTGQVETRKVTHRSHYALNSSGIWEAFPPAPEETEVSWYLGAKFGGEFSLPGLLVSALIVSGLNVGYATNP